MLKMERQRRESLHRVLSKLHTILSDCYEIYRNVKGLRMDVLFCIVAD